MTESTALAVQSQAPGSAALRAGASIYSSGIDAFDQAQRIAKALASSTLVPGEYRGTQGLANCLWAMELASQMRISPIVVMQNLTNVNGKPTWSAAFLIATINATGRFSPLQFILDNEAQPTSCYAVAECLRTGRELRGETITMAMAQAEGWVDRKGSKWKTMPGQMLRYRAATFWTRIYAPEISCGLAVAEEVEDVVNVVTQELPARPLQLDAQVAPLLDAEGFGTAPEPAVAATAAPDHLAALDPAPTPVEVVVTEPAPAAPQGAPAEGCQLPAAAAPAQAEPPAAAGPTIAPPAPVAQAQPAAQAVVNVAPEVAPEAPAAAPAPTAEEQRLAQISAQIGALRTERAIDAAAERIGALGEQGAFSTEGAMERLLADLATRRTALLRPLTAKKFTAATAHMELHPELAAKFKEYFGADATVRQVQHGLWLDAEAQALAAAASPI